MARLENQGEERDSTDSSFTSTTRSSDLRTNLKPGGRGTEPAELRRGAGKKGRGWGYRPEDRGERKEMEGQKKKGALVI